MKKTVLISGSILVILVTLAVLFFLFPQKSDQQSSNEEVQLVEEASADKEKKLPVWQRGSMQQIAWSGTLPDSDYDVLYVIHLDNADHQYIIADVKNVLSYEWAVGNGLYCGMTKCEEVTVPPGVYTITVVKNPQSLPARSEQVIGSVNITD